MTQQQQQRQRRQVIFQRFLLGGFSCQCAAMVTNPVDVVKTRMQLCGELGGQALGYHGLWGSAKKVYTDEGFRGFYKGIQASILREGVYSTIRMGTYEPFKQMFGATDRHHTPMWKKILAAGAAGCVGAIIANPTDLIKVRFQAQLPGEPLPYPSTLSGFTTVYREEGFQGLMRGWSPSTQRAILLTGSQLSSYDHFKHTMINHNLMEEGVMLHLTSSVLAGFICAVTTAPHDNIKTRIMKQKRMGDLYSGTLDCAIKTVKAEGPTGLYKGFLSQWLRIGPHTIVAFLVFEELRKVFGITPI